MKMGKWRWVGVLSASVLLTGCNLVSDPSLYNQTSVQRTVNSSGLSAVSSAIGTMNNVNTYDLKATMQAHTSRYVQTVQFYGSIKLPGTVTMNETIGGASYAIYQDGSFAYQRDGTKWTPTQPITNLTPWQSLAHVISTSPPKVVYQLPQQTVVTWLCNVYQFKAPSNGSVFGGLGTSSSVTKQTGSHEALYTVWVDTTDGKLRQVEVQSTVGIPGLGTTAFDAKELYFGFNNPRTKFKIPIDLLSQIERP